jgi:choline-sulfatase
VATQPANVLFIMSDQHSRHVLGCYGNAAAQTPALDGLAAGGTRFANGYCNFPICVPSRASFATGRYAHQIGTWDNASPYVGTEAASWGHRLTEQGHTVTTIGKLHYRQVGDPSGFPDQRLPMHVLAGEGDLYGLLRADMPVRSQSRRQVLEARPGESEYTRYDRAIARAAVRWLQEEAPEQRRPWCLFVSFVTPHFPLIAPPEHFHRFHPDDLPWPVQGRPEEWPHHQVMERHRRQQALDQPFDEATVRNALVAYYGLVRFMDEQVGRVLQAVDAAGLRDRTRIVYTSDHGEMLGEHGMWWKSSLYEASAGVPLIVAGPDILAGKVSNTNVSLVDCFPTIVEGVGAEFAPVDRDLPGRSLWPLAQQPDQSRQVFAEYHAIFSPSAAFMLRDGRYKYHHYVGFPPQLFDLRHDPNEEHDLAADPAHAGIRAQMEEHLRSIVDPEEVDRQAHADQQRKITAAGGKEAIIAGGVKIPFTPAPQEFAPEATVARGESEIE